MGQNPHTPLINLQINSRISIVWHMVKNGRTKESKGHEEGVKTPQNQTKEQPGVVMLKIQDK